MNEWGEGQNSVKPKDNTTLWIVGGLVAGCVCLVAVGAVGLLAVGGLTLFGASAAAVNTPAGAVFASTPIPQETRSLPGVQQPTPTGAPVGQTIDLPDMGRAHVPEGTVVAYNSSPPTSGPHYPTPLPAGFYTESVPDGYIVHSMEHGYVVIWYDCETLSESGCQTLKDDIQGLINHSTQKKLIGIPRDGMDHVIALTSWTRLEFLDDFDAAAINAYIKTNILQAPEPAGP